MRPEDWPERMRKRLLLWEKAPFIRDETDCVEFAIDMVKAVSDRVIVNPARGQYHTEADAQRCLRAMGGTLKEIVSSYLGEPVHVNYAQRGDILLNDGMNLGVCIGMHGKFRSITGLMEIEASKCDCAWRID